MVNKNSFERLFFWYTITIIMETLSKNISALELASQIINRNDFSKKDVILLGSLINEENFYDEGVPLSIDLQSEEGKKQYDHYIKEQDVLMRKKVEENIDPFFHGFWIKSGMTTNNFLSSPTPYIRADNYFFLAIFTSKRRG